MPFVPNPRAGQPEKKRQPGRADRRAVREFLFPNKQPRDSTQALFSAGIAAGPALVPLDKYNELTRTNPWTAPFL
jgi:hypothetical protein